MKKTVRVSIVSYLNSQPFLHALQNQQTNLDMTLERDIPSVCAAKVLEGSADVGLIPVAVLPGLSHYEILTNHCIGCVGEVGSVLLMSEVPIDQIKEIYLDYQSRTSVRLLRILCERHWQVSPQWLKAEPGYENQIKGERAGLVIGDRTFGMMDRFPYIYDLGAEWFAHTGLPFVFACWVANRPIEKAWKDQFTKVIASGIAQKEEVIQSLEKEVSKDIPVRDYLTNKISYDLNEEKRKGLDLFLNLVAEQDKAPV